MCQQWTPNGLQTVFLVFYAIFWGGIFNVQARWKAFHWPLIFPVPQARWRTMLSFVVLNVLSLFYIVVALCLLERPAPLRMPLSFVVEYLRAIIPAFAAFAFYRIWLGLIEISPKTFYACGIDQVPEKYRLVEPTFRKYYRESREATSAPVVDLGPDTGVANLLFGVIYLIVSTAVLWI
jgi:hypothetical protein